MIRCNYNFRTLTITLIVFVTFRGLPHATNHNQTRDEYIRIKHDTAILLNTESRQHRYKGTQLLKQETGEHIDFPGQCPPTYILVNTGMNTGELQINTIELL